MRYRPINLLTYLLKSFFRLNLVGYSRLMIMLMISFSRPMAMVRATRSARLG